MARTAKDIEAQITKLEAWKKITRARNGRQHYSERINYLRGELALQRAEEARAEDAGLGVGLSAGNPTRLATKS